MVAWMDDEALARTLATREATYFSRSRSEYWVKGETSGHTQHVHEVRLDCDGDTVLLVVDQVGAACHTGDAHLLRRRCAAPAVEEFLFVVLPARSGRTCHSRRRDVSWSRHSDLCDVTQKAVDSLSTVPTTSDF